MLKLFRFLRPYWWQVIILLLATGLQVYTTLRLPALMAEIINKGIVPGDTGYIWMTGIRMIGLTLVSAAGSLISSYFAARVGTAYARDVRRAVFTKVINFNLLDLKEFSTASLLTRTTNDVNQVQMVTIMLLSIMLRSPLFLVISVIMAMQTAPDMSWIIWIGATAIIGSAILIMSLVMPKFKVFQDLIELISLLHLVLVFLDILCILFLLLVCIYLQIFLFLFLY